MNEYTNLHMVRQKYSTGETAANATGYVDDADAETTGKFLQISHDKELKQHGDDELQQPAAHLHVTSIKYHQILSTKLLLH